MGQRNPPSRRHAPRALRQHLARRIFPQVRAQERGKVEDHSLAGPWLSPRTPQRGLALRPAPLSPKCDGPVHPRRTATGIDHGRSLRMPQGALVVAKGDRKRCHVRPRRGFAMGLRAQLRIQRPRLRVAVPASRQHVAGGCQAARGGFAATDQHRLQRRGCLAHAATSGMGSPACRARSIQASADCSCGNSSRASSCRQAERARARSRWASRLARPCRPRTKASG